MDIILGILLPGVLGFGLAAVVMSVFETRRENNRMRKQLEDCISDIEGFKTGFQIIERRIDDETRELYNTIGETGRNNIQLHEELKREVGELYRYVDSRHDKLENRLIEVIKNEYEPLKTAN
jgi:hypothetical protein